MGRVLGAGILIIRGTLGSTLGLRGAVVVLSGLFWVGLLILIVAPETRGHSCRSDGALPSGKNHATTSH